MSTHDEDILQHRINAYEKRIADLDEQLDRAWVQIAREQAALQLIASQDYEPIGESFTLAAAAIAKAALAAPARETE